MKWIYNASFVRGIGIGLIIAGILSWTNKPVKLTDQDIINRAIELGMIQKTETTKQEVPKAQQAQQAQQAQPQKNESTPEVRTTIITIPRGSNSTDVAEILKKAGFIKDNKLFLEHVDNKKAARKFKAGEFEIPNNISVDELIEILTK